MRVEEALRVARDERAKSERGQGRVDPVTLALLGEVERLMKALQKQGSDRRRLVKRLAEVPKDERSYSVMMRLAEGLQEQVEDLEHRLHMAEHANYWKGQHDGEVRKKRAAHRAADEQAARARVAEARVAELEAELAAAEEVAHR